MPRQWHIVTRPSVICKLEAFPAGLTFSRPWLTHSLSGIRSRSAKIPFPSSSVEMSGSKSDASCLQKLLDSFDIWKRANRFPRRIRFSGLKGVVPERLGYFPLAAWAHLPSIPPLARRRNPGPAGSSPLLLAQEYSQSQSTPASLVHLEWRPRRPRPAMRPPTRSLSCCRDPWVVVAGTAILHGSVPIAWPVPRRSCSPLGRRLAPARGWSLMCGWLFGLANRDIHFSFLATELKPLTLWMPVKCKVLWCQK